MADSADKGSDGKNVPQSPGNDSLPQHLRENPFIAFRRYADEHISALLQSVMGLPSAFSSPSTNSWLVFRDQNLTQQIHPRNEAQESGLEPRDAPTSNNYHCRLEGQQSPD